MLKAVHLRDEEAVEEDVGLEGRQGGFVHEGVEFSMQRYIILN